MFYTPRADRYRIEDSLGTVNLDEMDNTLNPAEELSFNDEGEHMASSPRNVEPQVPVEPVRHNPRPMRQRRAPDRLGINSVRDSLIETFNALIKQEVLGKH